MRKSDKNKSLIKNINTFINENFENQKSIDWHGVTVNIKKSIAFYDMVTFVSGVCESCFDDNGAYLPQLFDFAVRVNAIGKYTDFPIPDSESDRYRLCYETDLMDIIFEEINMTQFSDIIRSAEKKADNIAMGNISMLNKQISDVERKIEDITSQVSEMFGNLSKTDISNLLGAIENGKIDEEKLVRAYVNMKEFG